MTADPRTSVAGRDFDPAASASHPEAESFGIGLALSGGGVRAALFSLGVVIGLIEVGFHRRLRCMTSVSGGSIVNAALAHGPSLNSLPSLKEFEPLASALAASLAWRGVFAFDARAVGAAVKYVVGVVIRAIPVALGVAIGISPILGPLMANVRLQSLDLTQLPWVWLGAIAAVSVVAVIVFSRGLFQQTRYDAVLSAIGAVLKSNSGRLYVRDWADAAADSQDAIMHVLVATDLLSGEPMYFSKRFVYCRPYGWSPPGDLRTAEALYSSAAFPAVFPPKRLKLNRFRFVSGKMSGELPRRVRLADGGVYNNLGTDWFEVLGSQARRLAEGPAAELWPFGKLDVQPPSIAPENVIVVNASAPSRKIDRILPMFTVARIMSVLYDNTVQPRLDTLIKSARPVIDVSESPLRLAERLAQSEGEDGRRAHESASRLQGMGDSFWDDLTRDTAGTPTKLTPAGTRTGARLMLHGYLSTLVLLNARFGVAFPEPRSDDYFLSLVSGQKVASADSATSPAATDAKG